MAIQLDEEGLAGQALPWDHVDPGTQQCWVAVVTQMWAELSALQIGVPASIATDSDVGMLYVNESLRFDTEPLESGDVFLTAQGPFFQAMEGCSYRRVIYLSLSRRDHFNNVIEGSGTRLASEKNLLAAITLLKSAVAAIHGRCEDVEDAK